MAAATILIGALATSLVVYFLGHLIGGPPGVLVAAVAFFCAGIGAGVLPNLLPNSSWRIPQAWARWGQAWYAMAFGMALGIGFLTAIPSVGFYVLILGALTLNSIEAVAAVFLAYGFARALPIPLVAIAAALHRPPDNSTEQVRRLANLALPLEVAVLVMVGVTLGSG